MNHTFSLRFRMRKNKYAPVQDRGVKGAGDEVRTRDIQLGRLTLCQLSYSRSLPEGNLVVGEGFEPSKAEPADLQSAPVDRLGTPP